LAWDTLLPVIGPLPVTSQTLDMELSADRGRPQRRQNGRLLYQNVPALGSGMSRAGGDWFAACRPGLGAFQLKGSRKPEVIG
ncbi:MAG: hypothetical protein PHC73_12225, partial [Immundisolibacter sp.]